MQTKHQWNIQDQHGRLMLGDNLTCIREALRWQQYYKRTYGVGVMYPNGKGFYSGIFTVVLVSGG